MSRPTEQKMWLICDDGNVRQVDATRVNRDDWQIEESGEHPLHEEGRTIFENPLVAYERAIERLHRHLRHITETTTKQLKKLTEELVHVACEETRERIEWERAQTGEQSA